VILAAYTPPHSSYPSVGGFRTALLIGAALCLFTAVLTFFLPGATKAHDIPSAASDEKQLVDEMEENAELGGAGLMLDEGLGIT
jgi:hypothetical protein